MPLITLMVAEEHKLSEFNPLYQEMHLLEGKLDTLLQKEQELNVNGP